MYHCLQKFVNLKVEIDINDKMSHWIYFLNVFLMRNVYNVKNVLDILRKQY